MNENFIQHIVLSRIERQGRLEGAALVKFADKKISTEEIGFVVGNDWLAWITLVSAFYLALPPNAFAVVTFPDGLSRNLVGGLYKVPIGTYKLKFVDKNGRSDTTSRISELTQDREKLTIRVLVRYKIIDPVAALSITRPVETLMEHIEADVAQYIRTHDHNDIADSSGTHDYNKLLSFFLFRHNQREGLSQAFSIEGVEIKEFSGDVEYVEMRRKETIQKKQIEIEKDYFDLQKEMQALKINQQNEISAIVTKAEADNQALRNQILYESQRRDILLQNFSQQASWRHELVVKAVDAIGQALEPSGYPRNNEEIKAITSDLIVALREDSLDFEPASAEKTQAGRAGTVVPKGGDKIERLTNTLLGLLKTKS